MASKRVALIDATDLFPQDQRDILVQVALTGCTGCCGARRFFRKPNWGTSDVDDRHVIAAAIVGGADTLVTSDGRFDAVLCEKAFELRVVGADDFAPFNCAQVVETPLPKAMAYLVDARGFPRDHPPTA